MPLDPSNGRRTRKTSTTESSTPRHPAPSDAAVLASLAGRSKQVGDQELKALFGDDVAELRRLAAARDRAPKRRGAAPKVYLLHGIMGSELGRSRTFWEDVIWLGLTDILLGNLKRLQLGPEGDRQVKALGFLPGVYLMMQLHLENEGFEVVPHVYDWRQNLQDLGADLRRRVAAEKKPVQIVAHSMGGLVTTVSMPWPADSSSTSVALSTT